MTDAPATAAETDFDAIVIGSGIGGLTTAALLARLHNWRVLVLEQHYRAGGFTHTFKRAGGYEWDTGVHYIGQLAETGAARKLFDYISEKRLRWRRLPEPFDVFEYPDFTFTQTAGADSYREALIAQFPAEEKSIRRYLKDVKRATRWQNLRGLLAGKRGPMRWSFRLLTGRGRRLGTGLTADYLARNFRDPKLRALLASIWLDYGLPPSLSAFATHALLVQHYFDGAHYPDGGSSAIAESIVPTIESRGGKVQLRCQVNEITLAGSRAIGVAAVIGKESRSYTAPRVFSGVGAWNTYTGLLPDGMASKHVAELRALEQPDHSLVTLYIGFKQDPRTLGFTGANHWISSSYDHEQHVLRISDDCKASYAVLSFGTLKAGTEGPHTAEVMAVVRYADFSGWADSGWKNRGDEYEALKTRIAESLLDLVEGSHPGFRAIVDHIELSTPLSLKHFAGAHQGGAYGIPATPAKFELSSLTPGTPIRGLYLTGADALSFGIVGAAFGGVAAVGKQLGWLGFFRVMSSIYKHDIRSRRRKA